jgi:hypothetical protein
MKLAAIALSFTIPLFLTTYFLVNEGNIKINFAIPTPSRPIS